jgi:hypothetical protein
MFAAVVPKFPIVEIKPIIINVTCLYMYLFLVDHFSMMAKYKLPMDVFPA